jgi:bilin biosynthesis protein
MQASAVINKKMILGMADSQRFDNLFAWMSESNAISVINQSSQELANPGIKYIAATRLGACTSPESLDALLIASQGERADIFERITRRKAIEALGRRKDASTLSVIMDALHSDDEPTVVNSIDSLISIGLPLNHQSKTVLCKCLFHHSTAVSRAAIQCLNRLGVDEFSADIAQLEVHSDHLVSGAALAHSVQFTRSQEKLDLLCSRLLNPVVAVRRAAVIDLGDAGHEACLPYLALSPVSMPLRAKSALRITGTAHRHIFDANLEKILVDDARYLSYPADMSEPASTEEIVGYLRHRDEGKQYLGAKKLLELDKSEQTSALSDVWTEYGSDYGVHYLITSIISLARQTDLAHIAIEALNNKEPQYAKSRIAAVWACLNLGLVDQRPAIERLFLETKWEPLKITCFNALKLL